MAALATTTLIARFITSFMIEKFGRIDHLRYASFAFLVRQCPIFDR